MSKRERVSAPVASAEVEEKDEDARAATADSTLHRRAPLSDVQHLSLSTRSAPAAVAKLSGGGEMVCCADADEESADELAALALVLALALALARATAVCRMSSALSSAAGRRRTAHGRCVQHAASNHSASALACASTAANRRSHRG